jgi:nucleoside-diphosphate-sugar epimerase
MKILFTGVSSFTGFWFVKELVNNGHEVYGIFRRERDEYIDTRGVRVEKIEKEIQSIFNCDFGSSRFVELLRGHDKFDIFCHHAADVSNYKSNDFNVVQALKNNTENIQNVLNLLKEKGCQRIVLTGSAFEQNEGAGSENLPAFSPYGLSKGLTSDVFKFYSRKFGLSLGKFVIPNPFGPFEEPRFTDYLIKNWFDDKIPGVLAPRYVRDNIHISLLSKYYVYFMENILEHQEFIRLNPSGYPETQGSFAQRFADEMRKRLNLPCKLKFMEQKEFNEPGVRINTDNIDYKKLEWDEKKAWDELARYYEEKYKKQQ